MKEFRYSEIFGNTVQGEGKYTGIPTIWIRFFGCNFQCQGFGQKDPTDPSTWVHEYQDLDLSRIDKLEDIPVLRFGCDSSYSWAKKFGHLAHKAHANDICDELEKWLRDEELNPEAKFLHPQSNQWTHMAFTGGEPMMNQRAIAEIMGEFESRNNVPKFVTVETNGTQALREDLASTISRFRMSSEFNGMLDDKFGTTEWFWSVSPKLSASGEPWKKAILPEVVSEYARFSNRGQLKYVVDGSERCWNEVEKATDAYREKGVDWPVWIMPVGSTEAQQENIQAAICEEAVRRGYNFSMRAHCFIFGNVIGK